MAFKIYNKLVDIALLFGVFCLTSEVQSKFFYLLTPKDVQEVWQHGEICSKEVGYPVSDLNQLIKWPVPNTKAMKQIYQCVRHNTGFTDRDGHMIEEKYKSLKRLNGTEEEVTKVLRDCNKVTLEDPVETNYAGGDCLSKSSVFAIQTESGDLDILFEA